MPAVPVMPGSQVFRSIGGDVPSLREIGGPHDGSPSRGDHQGQSEFPVAVQIEMQLSQNNKTCPGALKPGIAGS